MNSLTSSAPHIARLLSVAGLMACLCLVGSASLAADTDESQPKSSALGRLARPKTNTDKVVSEPAPTATPPANNATPNSAPKKSLSGLSGLKMPKASAIPPTTPSNPSPAASSSVGAAKLGHPLGKKSAMPPHKPLGSALKTPPKLPSLLGTSHSTSSPEEKAAPKMPSAKPPTAPPSEEFSALLGDDKPAEKSTAPSQPPKEAGQAGALGGESEPQTTAISTAAPAPTTAEPPSALGGEPPASAAAETSGAPTDAAKSSVFGDVGLPATPSAPAEEEKPAETDVKLKYEANFAKVSIYGSTNGSDDRLEMTLVAANRWETDAEFALLESGDLGGFLFEATKRDQTTVDFGLLKLLSHDIYANGIGYRDGQAFERPDFAIGGVIFGIPKPGAGKYRVVFDDIRRIYTCSKL